MKRVLVPILIGLFVAALGDSPVSADPPPTSVLLTSDVLQAIAADNALFASLDSSSTDPSGRQTISVSFFAGHVGPVTPSGSAHWTNTMSNDSDTYSIEIDIPAGGTPADGFSSFAGINFHHVPPTPPANAPEFDFQADKTAPSGGSPRLVMIFSDGGNINLRPLAWVQNTWVTEGTGATSSDWDNNGGSCGFLFQQPYPVVTACHTGATVTAAFIVSDSGWLSAPYINWIDNVQYNGQTISQPSNSAH